MLLAQARPAMINHEARPHPLLADIITLERQKEVVLVWGGGREKVIVSLAEAVGNESFLKHSEQTVSSFHYLHITWKPAYK